MLSVIILFFALANFIILVSDWSVSLHISFIKKTRQTNIFFLSNTNLILEPVAINVSWSNYNESVKNQIRITTKIKYFKRCLGVYSRWIELRGTGEGVVKALSCRISDIFINNFSYWKIKISSLAFGAVVRRQKGLLDVEARPFRRNFWSKGKLIEDVKKTVSSI